MTSVIVYKMIYIVFPYNLMSIISVNNLIFALVLLVSIVDIGGGSLLSTLLPGQIPDYGETALNEGLGSYDFIVVGAGSAGAIVAARLSELANWKVLLLEAGGDPPLISKIPAFRASMLHSSVDWGFNSKSPNVCKIKGDEGCYTARGKMLGGTSSFNWMIYVRGTAADFDEWAALGNDGWSYKDVLPYFKKFEGNTNESIVAIDDGIYHNANGPVKIESIKPFPADKRLIAAFAEAGLDIIPDINADKTVGWYTIQTTTSEGTRSSTAQAYLLPNARRDNLHIIKYAYVDRVVLDANNRARRVEFTYKNAHKLIAECTKEVIVSGGTIQSPTILMRSGIGPREQLKKHNIPCKVDLAVGENFKDHVCVALILKSNILPQSFLPTKILTVGAQYLLFKTGEGAGLYTFGGRIDTTNCSGEPDVLYEWANVPKNTPEFTIRTTNRLLNLEPMDELLIETNKNYVLTYVLFYAIKPKSVGFIELDENLEADITTGYLTDEEDTDTLLRGIRYALSLAYSKPLQKHGFSVVHIPLAECDELVYDSDEYWKCYIRHVTSSGTHMVGTCKMGRDSKSVVDPQLNVYGATGVRVVDCSIMPDNVRGNTNAAAMMVGEKGADLIKYTYLKS